MAYSKEELDVLKEKFEAKNKNKALYKADILEEEYIFTTIDKNLIKELESMQMADPSMSSTERDEIVVQKCLIAPELNKAGWAALPAGVVPTLAMHIMDRSGFYVDGFSSLEMITSIPITDIELAMQPTDEEIEELKKDIKWPLYKIKAGNKYVIFKPVSRGEWKAINSNEFNDVELETCKVCVVWPADIDWEDELIGATRTVLQAVMDKSGFSMTPEEAQKL